MNASSEVWKVRSVGAGDAHARCQAVCEEGGAEGGAAPRPPVSTRVSGAARALSAASGLFLYYVKYQDGGLRTLPLQRARPT